MNKFSRFAEHTSHSLSPSCSRCVCLFLLLLLHCVYSSSVIFVVVAALVFVVMLIFFLLFGVVLFKMDKNKVTKRNLRQIRWWRWWWRKGRWTDEMLRNGFPIQISVCVYSIGQKSDQPKLPLFILSIVKLKTNRICPLAHNVLQTSYIKYLFVWKKKNFFSFLGRSCRFAHGMSYSTFGEGNKTSTRMREKKWFFMIEDGNE